MPRLTKAEELRHLIEGVAKSEDPQTFPPTRTGYDHWTLSDQEGLLWSFLNDHRNEILAMYEAANG